jgi:hypothetical protein
MAFRPFRVTDLGAGPAAWLASVIVVTTCGESDRAGSGTSGRFEQADEYRCDAGNYDSSGSSTIELPSDDGFPCRIVGVPLEIILEPSLDGRYPDPSSVHVVRNAAGLIYTSATVRTGPAILEWGSAGDFIRSVGERGSGPGEFTGYGELPLFLSPGDSIYVADGARWSVFDPELRFARTITSRHLSGAPAGVHITDDGGFLITRYLPGADRESWFHVLDREGELIRSFGRGSRAPEAGDLGPPRASAHTGGESFWVGPIEGLPDGLRLEEWRLDGTLLRAITLEVQLPLSVPDPILPRRSLPRVTALHQDGDGRLWVFLQAIDPAAPRTAAPSDDHSMPVRYDSEGTYDWHYYVLDPERRIVVAAGSIDENPFRSNLVQSFLRGTSVAYRRTPDPLGVAGIEFFEMQLAGR